MDLPPVRIPATMPMPVYQQQQPLTGIDKPHSNDVLCGRGVTTNRHCGNESFRSLVNCNKELYVTSTKKQKMKISRSIVDAVRSLDPPGRFLEKDPTSGKWFDIGDKKAVEKTSQALRDGAAGLRKQLSQDLNDPDFLSAVFDMDKVPVPEEEKTNAQTNGGVKKDKKTAAKKGHRRVKSNPSVGTSARAKQMMAKKQQKAPEIPTSPRSARPSVSIHITKPPMSPPVTSPRSPDDSPRPDPPLSSQAGPPHRRAHSQGSVPVYAMTGSPVGFYPPHRGPPSRSNSFEHTNEHGRPPPPRFASPPPAYHPMSPLNHTGSPYQMHPRPYQPPVSPRWSPRTGYARSGHQSLSPHPYMHPSDFHRRSSPDRRFYPTSPRDYSRHLSYHQPPSQGYQNHHLSVPALGIERGSSPRMHNGTYPPSPLRNPHPLSPRHYGSPHGGTPHTAGQWTDIPRSQALVPVDFTPPQSFSRRATLDDVPSSSMNDVHMDEKKDDDGDQTMSIDDQRPKYHHDHDIPFDESKPSSDSPAAVADVAKSADIVKEKELMMSLDDDDEKVDDFPFDEDPNPADDRYSPLNFFEQEDPSSLMELPDNLLSLPISPCGPHDYGEI